MSYQEVVETLNRCLEKAERQYVWHASCDEDEETNIYINSRGEIYIKGHAISHNCSEITKIRFRQLYFNIDENGEEHDFYVKI